MFNIREWNKQANIVADILSKAPKFDKDLRVDREEFERRQKTLYQKLKEAGFDGGIVYSDEHYHGDVPYLGGNTNISVEPVAGIIGVNGFSILAGLEGCYVAEQLSKRSGCRVGRVEMLKLADEEYPVEVERLENVVEDICGGKPKRRSEEFMGMGMRVVMGMTAGNMVVMDMHSICSFIVFFILYPDDTFLSSIQTMHKYLMPYWIYRQGFRIIKLLKEKPIVCNQIAANVAYMDEGPSRSKERRCMHWMTTVLWNCT